jgi:hypothetical protein
LLTLYVLMSGAVATVLFLSSLGRIRIPETIVYVLLVILVILLMVDIVCTLLVGLYEATI